MHTPAEPELPSTTKAEEKTEEKGVSILLIV